MWSHFILLFSISTALRLLSRYRALPAAVSPAFAFACAATSTTADPRELGVRVQALCWLAGTIGLRILLRFRAPPLQAGTGHSSELLDATKRAAPSAL